MNRVSQFVNKVITPELRENGFYFLGDEMLFMEDMLELLVEDLDMELNTQSKETKIKGFNQLRKFVNQSEYFEKYPEDRLKYNAAVDYQFYLYDNDLDKRHKKRVREILSQEILRQEKSAKIEQDKYLFIPKRAKLYFIANTRDLLDYLGKIEDNSGFFYRGQSNINWDVKPSIYRKSKWIHNEQKIFRDILIRNPEEFIQANSAFDKLTIMQHYGLPTRLLDITKNPLVALYFACSDTEQKKQPAQLVVYKAESSKIKYYDSDTVSVISNLAKVERDFNYDIDKTIFNQSDSGLKLLHLIKEEKPYFESKIIPKDLEKSFIVKPINNNERIKRQQGYFVLVGIQETVNQQANIEIGYTEKEGVKPILIIESYNKMGILQELDLLGISHDSLFPEIDNGANYLKGKYSD